jgi:hypothetical protein
MWNHPEAENPKLKRVKSPIEYLIFLQRDLGLKTVGHKTYGGILRSGAISFYFYPILQKRLFEA